MPRRKTLPKELTTDEAMRKMFPKKAVDKAKKEAENPRGTTPVKNIDSSKQ